MRRLENDARTRPSIESDAAIFVEPCFDHVPDGRSRVSSVTARPENKQRATNGECVGRRSGALGAGNRDRADDVFLILDQSARRSSSRYDGDPLARWPCHPSARRRTLSPSRLKRGGSFGAARGYSVRHKTAAGLRVTSAAIRRQHVLDLEYRHLKPFSVSAGASTKSWHPETPSWNLSAGRFSERWPACRQRATSRPFHRDALPAPGPPVEALTSRR
jgi:hypothetical protein